MSADRTIEGSGAAPPLDKIVEGDVAAIVDRCGDDIRRFEGTTVLISGAAGFLPSHVVDALAHANRHHLTVPCRLLCVDNFVTGLPTRLAHLQGRADVEFVTADLSKGLDISEPVHHIVHAASIASPTWYRRFPLETIDVNVNGSRHLLELARRSESRSFLFMSSSEIYGDPPADRIPTSEEYWGHVSSTGPRACYDESKRLGETLVMTYHRLYDLDVKLIRPFNVYGPRLRLDDGRIVPDLISGALKGGPLVLYSDGRATRSFCYVQDAATALLLLLAHVGDSGPYNVGNDHEVTILELAETLDRLCEGQLGIELRRSDDAQYLTDNPQRRSPDLTKTRSTIPWKPEIDLEEGLARTLAHYREGSAA